MLREEKQRQTALGIEADKLTGDGQLVPDELVVALVRGWLERNRDGFVFDGFPRTLGQARALDEILDANDRPLELVIALEAPTEALRARMSNRLVCSQCKETIALGWQVRSADEACPKCGGALIRRKDDCDEVFERRMAEHANKTAPLLDYYADRSMLVRIEAARPAGAVFQDIQLALERP